MICIKIRFHLCFESTRKVMEEGDNKNGPTPSTTTNESVVTRWWSSLDATTPHDKPPPPQQSPTSLCDSLGGPLHWPLWHPSHHHPLQQNTSSNAHCNPPSPPQQPTTVVFFGCYHPSRQTTTPNESQRLIGVPLHWPSLPWFHHNQRVATNSSVIFFGRYHPSRVKTNHYTQKVMKNRRWGFLYIAHPFHHHQQVATDSLVVVSECHHPLVTNHHSQWVARTCWGVLYTGNDQMSSNNTFSIVWVLGKYFFSEMAREAGGREKKAQMTHLVLFVITDNFFFVIYCKYSPLPSFFIMINFWNFSQSHQKSPVTLCLGFCFIICIELFWLYFSF